MDYITGTQAKKDFEEYKHYSRKKNPLCICGKEILNPVEVRTETETGEKLDFLCNEDCIESLKPVA